jgi:hypothetical protein
VVSKNEYAPGDAEPETGAYVKNSRIFLTAPLKIVPPATAYPSQSNEKATTTHLHTSQSTHTEPNHKKYYQKHEENHPYTSQTPSPKQYNA